MFVFLVDDPDFPPEWKPHLEIEHYQERILGKFIYVDTTPGARWWPSGTIGQLDGKLVLLRLELEPSQDNYLDRPPPGGVQSSDLRALRPGELLGEIRKALADRMRTVVWIEKMFPEVEVPAEQIKMAERGTELANLSEQPRRGRPRLDYQAVAHEIIAMQERDGSKGLLKRLAVERKVELETVRTWVWRARIAKYLASGTRGKAGFVPGPRFYEGMEPPAATEHGDKEQPPGKKRPETGKTAGRPRKRA
jgi:hypothetical protein